MSQARWPILSLSLRNILQFRTALTGTVDGGTRYRFTGRVLRPSQRRSSGFSSSGIWRCVNASSHYDVSAETYWRNVLLLFLPLSLQPTVGFGLSNNVLPFFPICLQLSPSSHSQHLKISLYFLFPSFPGSSPSSLAFQFLGEELLGILSYSILSRWPNQLILCPFIHFTIFCPLLISSSSRFVRFFHSQFWPVEQCPSIFSYLPPTLSTFSLPALEDLFLLPLSIFSWVFPFFSSLPVLGWRSFRHPILLHSL